MYEYIVFRGSDVKDLNIVEAAAKDVQKPQMPNDPAILGVSYIPFPFFLNSTAIMMKHSGCKNIIVLSKSAKPCGHFPLPSF